MEENLNEKEVHQLVEAILELYAPELGIKYGYAYPITDNQGTMHTIWKIEEMWELTPETLKDLITKLENEKNT